MSNQTSSTAASQDADWERQRAFIAVIEEGSLSGAARRLQVAQPTVRRRIEDLERQLRVTLFTRSPAGLLPTDAALDLTEPAKAMAIAADRFLRTASADAQAPAGTVRISASDTIGVEVLPPILAALRREYPGIVLEVGLSDRSEDMLKRQADIAIRMTPPTQSALVARSVGIVRLGLYAHPSYLDAIGGPPSDLDALARSGLIGFETETVAVRALRTQGLVLRHEDFILRSDNDLCRLAAIRSGIGIGICQVGLAARDGDLVAVLPDKIGFDLPTWVVMHEDMRKVHRVRLTFDALVEALTKYTGDSVSGANKPINKGTQQ